MNVSEFTCSVAAERVPEAAGALSVTGTVADDKFSSLYLRQDAAAGDVSLPYTMPHAEYMYGCVATSVGMLLGYYDLYGWTVGDKEYSFSNMIPGTISVNSRGSDGGSIYDMKDPSVLANFIASKEYISQFYGTTPEQELPYTFVDGDPSKGLNISQWNCLAHYLGTGQYYRGNTDLGTSYYYMTLKQVENTTQTRTIDQVTIPIKYADLKYGLSLYVESVGYKLDADATKSVSIDNFTFENYMAEIDAGRPVLVSMNSSDGGHMVIGYGYNSATQEIIFDDTYRSDCRMGWSGTYEYANATYQLSGMTTVVFDVSGMTPGSSGTVDPTVVSSAVISTYTVVSSGYTYLSPSVVSGGTLQVSSGGLVSAAAVSAGGSLFLENGGLASGTVVSSGGAIFTVDDGKNIGTTLLAGANGYLSRGGTARGAVVSSGGLLTVGPDGVAAEAVISSGGTVSVSSGGMLSAAQVLAGGSNRVLAGGSASATEVASQGYVAVGGSGVMRDVAVQSGGQVVVEQGGKITGSMTLAGTSAVSVASGGMVEFDLVGRKAASGVLVNNLASITGTPSFTVSVAAAQATGLYQLADGAADFTGSITLRADGSTVGSLTVGGAALLYNELYYELKLSGSALSLKVRTESTPVSTVDAPTVTADITEPTDGPVKVSAVFAEGTVTKQYSRNGKTWYTYTEGISVTANTTLYFRGLDKNGTATDIVAYTVSNIVKVAPDIPTVTADVTAPTRGNVTVTAKFSSDSATKQYSLDGRSWKVYTGAVVMTENGTVYFRGLYSSGQPTGVASYVVSNIDRVAPDAPTVTASTAKPTNGDVTLTVTYTQDSVTKQYSTDGKSWQDYSKPLVISANTTRYFRSIDAAGNISKVVAYKVTNIDKVAPAAPTVKVGRTDLVSYKVTLVASFSSDSVTKQYSLDGKNWFSCGDSGVAVSGNSTVRFRAIDAAGNISDVTTYKVGRIGATAKAGSKLTGVIGENRTYVNSYAVALKRAGLYSVTGDFGTLNGTVAILSGTKKVATGKVRSGELVFNKGKSVLLELGRPYAVVVTNTDKGKSASQYDLMLTADALFTKGDNSDDAPETAKDLGKVVKAGKLADGWVGYGDSKDVMKFTLDTAASLNFTVSSGDNVRVSIAAAEHQDKALQKLSVNSRNGEQVSVSSKKPLLLTAGTYYVTVTSPNAARGGNASYSLSVGPTSTFFPKGDNSDDTWQAAAGKPPKTVGDTISGWVGYGDAADHRGITVDRDGFLALDLDSVTADAAARRQIKLELVDESGKKVALSAFDGDTWISRQMVGAGTYFLGVSCTNVRKYNTSYGVTVGMLA